MHLMLQDKQGCNPPQFWWTQAPQGQHLPSGQTCSSKIFDGLLQCIQPLALVVLHCWHPLGRCVACGMYPDKSALAPDVAGVTSLPWPQASVCQQIPAHGANAQPIPLDADVCYAHCHTCRLLSQHSSKRLAQLPIQC